MILLLQPQSDAPEISVHSRGCHVVGVCTLRYIKGSSSVQLVLRLLSTLVSVNVGMCREKITSLPVLQEFLHHHFCYFFSSLSLSFSQDNHPELPESHHRPFPRQNMLQLQGGEGPGLPVLCCQCLGPGSGLPVSAHTLSHNKPCMMPLKHTGGFNYGLNGCRLLSMCNDQSLGEFQKLLHFVLSIILYARPNWKQYKKKKILHITRLPNVILHKALGRKTN